jgi:hypothetical protein
MRPRERQAPQPSGDALVWPMPVVDSDILWLAPDSVPVPKLGNAGVPAVRVDAAAPGNGISLARLLAPNVPMEWHDAVAVVSQLAATVLGDKRRPPAGALPAIGAIQLRQDGEILLRLDPNGSEPLTAGFGRVLQALLQDKPTPANLRLLAWRISSGAGASMTLDEFTGELGRWERPGRIEKLKILYQRASASGPVLPTIPSSVPVQVPGPVVESGGNADPPATVVVRFRSRTALMAAAAAVCVAFGGAGAWLLARRLDVRVPPFSTASSVPAAETATAADPPSAPPRAVERADRATPQPRPQTRTARSYGDRTRIGTTEERTPIRAGQAATTPEPSATRGMTSRSSTTTSPRSDSIANLAAPARVPPPPSAVMPDEQLYKSGDPGITDAILVKPYLPPRPRGDIPDTALGVLEVVVDARGLVESVHLKSPANRYREKWWLFTAKDWRFSPARKNGTPVRFLKRILLTDLNITEPQ